MRSAKKSVEDTNLASLANNFANLGRDEDEDDAASAVSTFSFTQNNEFGNSLWVSNSELEDLYDTMGRIQELLFGFFNPAAGEGLSYEHQLSELRAELIAVENNLRTARQNFYEIAEKVVICFVFYKL